MCLTFLLINLTGTFFVAFSKLYAKICCLVYYVVVNIEHTLHGLQSHYSNFVEKSKQTADCRGGVQGGAEGA